MAFPGHWVLRRAPKIPWKKMNHVQPSMPSSRPPCPWPPPRMRRNGGPWVQVGTLCGWYLAVRQGLGESAGAGSRSIGVQAKAELENLSQAHILLGCPGWGTEKRLTGSIKSSIPHTPCQARTTTSHRCRIHSGTGHSAANYGHNGWGEVGLREAGRTDYGRLCSTSTLEMSMAFRCCPEENQHNHL